MNQKYQYGKNQKWYTDLLINSRFQGVDRLFVLSFGNNGGEQVTQDISSTSRNKGL